MKAIRKIYKSNILGSFIIPPEAMEYLKKTSEIKLLIEGKLYKLVPVEGEQS